MSSLAEHDIVALSTTHVDYLSTATLADGSTMLTEDVWFDLVPAGPARADLVRVGLLVAAGVEVVALAMTAGRRRRDSLDAELQQLLTNERLGTS